MTRGEFPFPYHLLSTVSLSLTEWKTAHLTPTPRRVWGVCLCPKVTGFVTSTVRNAGGGGGEGRGREQFLMTGLKKLCRALPS